MKLDYSKLKNGSDIRGVAMEGIATEPVNLGSEEALRLTRGFYIWLMDKTGKEGKDITISVGHDSRLTGESLKNAVIQSLEVLGVRVLDCGLASTPSMFMSTIFEEYKADGAIMITASHLPFNRNGFKYFSKDGGLDSKDISTIISYAESTLVMEEMHPAKTADLKPVEKVDLIGTYSNYMVEKVRAELAPLCETEEEKMKPLSGLKIVVDAGNGASGFYADRILEVLGADTTGSVFLDPDGTFPNHQPNPENKAAMEAISKAVLDAKADLGIIFDTDGDRSSAVDGFGREISRNRIVALAAALISDENPGTTVVTDSITSDELTVYLEDLGLKHLRYKRGYKNVINKSIELNAAGISSELAIETSGHCAYRENYFLDDGAYLATKIVIKAAKLRKEGNTIDGMLKGLKEPSEAIEVRMPIKAADFKAYGDEVLKGFEAWAVENAEKGISVVSPNYEGVRLKFDMPELKGWCLLRKSLHDPIMPLNIETTVGACQEIKNVISVCLEKFGELEMK